MNQNEREFIYKIKGYLDSGAAQLKPGTLYRLQQARTRALSGLAPAESVAQERHQQALAGSPGSGASSSGNFFLLRNPRLWLGIALIAAAGIGYQHWQALQQTSEIAELDAQLLSSDLPIDAYLDKGFQAWLTRHEQ